MWQEHPVAVASLRSQLAVASGKLPFAQGQSRISMSAPDFTSRTYVGTCSPTHFIRFPLSLTRGHFPRCDSPAFGITAPGGATTVALPESAFEKRSSSHAERLAGVGSVTPRSTSSSRSAKTLLHMRRRALGLHSLANKVHSSVNKVTFLGKQGTFFGKQGYILR